MTTMARKTYTDLFGPTVGDRFRLADTNLVVEVERDYNAGHYGDEAVYGGGKAIRDGMGQDPAATVGQGALDLVITNVGRARPDAGRGQGRHRRQGRADRRRSARPATRTPRTAWTRGWSSAPAPRSSPANT